MQLLILLAFCSSCVLGQFHYVEQFKVEPKVKDNPHYHDQWLNFKTTYEKTYQPHEEMTKFAIFSDNLEYIEAHNRLHEAGIKSYSLGVNQFADMTFEEFQSYLKLGEKTPRDMIDGGATYIPANFLDIPTTVDWRTRGYVTPVKNQGQCGSCWAFSATGSLEGQHFRKTGQLLSFSEQQLVDCSYSYGNVGCNGGWAFAAFKYIMKFGIETEAAYPYIAKIGTCKYRKSQVRAKCTGYTSVTPGDEAALQQAVAQVGPVSVAIDAGHRSFQHYSSGVYNEPDCSRSQTDHGVLVVGYGTEGGDDYWLVKNSWGNKWGKSGYILMSRNKNDQCAIASSATFPNL